MPQLDVSTYPSQLFWLGLSFFLLWFFLQAWVVPRLSRTFDRRRRHIQSLLDQTAALQARIKALNQQAEEELAAVKTRSQDLIHETLGAVEQERLQEQTAFSKQLRQKQEETEILFQTARQQALSQVASLAPTLGKVLFNQIVLPNSTHREAGDS